MSEWFVQKLHDRVRQKKICASLELREDDVTSTLQAIRLRRDQGGQALLLRLGAGAGVALNDHLFPLLNTGMGGLTVSGDHLLFFQQAPDRALFVFPAELKSGRPGTARRQLENTCLLAEALIRHVTLRTTPRSARRR